MKVKKVITKIQIKKKKNTAEFVHQAFYKSMNMNFNENLAPSTYFFYNCYLVNEVMQLKFYLSSYNVQNMCKTIYVNLLLNNLTNKKKIHKTLY